MKATAFFSLLVLLPLTAWSAEYKCTTAFFVAKDYARDWYVQDAEGKDTLRVEESVTLEYNVGSVKNRKMISRTHKITTWEDCFEAARVRAEKESKFISGLEQVTNVEKGDSDITKKLKAIDASWNPVYRMQPLDYVYVYWKFEVKRDYDQKLPLLGYTVSTTTVTTTEKGAVTAASRECMLEEGLGPHRTGLQLYKLDYTADKRDHLGLSKAKKVCTNFNSYSSL